jgi:hypothetical protein
MYRGEFEYVMRDQRVQKYLCLDDDDILCGLSTYTMVIIFAVVAGRAGSPMESLARVTLRNYAGQSLHSCAYADLPMTARVPDRWGAGPETRGSRA